MNLDIRIPISILFLILGTIILACGFILPSETYQKSLNININLIWGILIIIFSGLMQLWIFIDKYKEKIKLNLKDISSEES
ncbi:MAG: hypothetical protein V2B14_00835 [bacterium]